MTIASGTFTIADADTSKAVTGVGFEPSAIIFFHPNSDTVTMGLWAANDVQAGGLGFGFAANDGNQACYTNAIYGGVDSHASHRIYNQDYCFMRAYNDQYSGWGEVSVWGKIDGALSVASYDADGFTLTVEVDFAKDCRVFYIAFQAPNAAITHIVDGGSTGNQAYTGVGFEPDALFSLHGYMTSGTTKTADSRGGIGFTDGVNSACMEVFDDSGLGAVDSKTSWNTTEFINHGIANRAQIVSFDSDGFTLNWIEVSGSAYPTSVLCLGGVDAYVGNIQTSTGGTNVAETGVGFEPHGVILLGSYYAKAAVNTWVDGLGVAFGFAATPTDRRTFGYDLRDGSTGYSDVTEWIYDDSMYTVGFNQSIISKIDLVSMDSDGFTFVMDTVDSSARDVAYIAIRIVTTDYRERLVKYLHNTYQSRRLGKTVFRDLIGRDVPPHQLEVDNFAFSGGMLFPTPVKYENLLENPNTYYFESLKPSEKRVVVETDRESFFESIMRKLGAQ